MTSETTEEGPSWYVTDHSGDKLFDVEGRLLSAEESMQRQFSSKKALIAAIREKAEFNRTDAGAKAAESKYRDIRSKLDQLIELYATPPGETVVGEDPAELAVQSPSQRQSRADQLRFGGSHKVAEDYARLQEELEVAKADLNREGKLQEVEQLVEKEREALEQARKAYLEELKREDPKQTQTPTSEVEKNVRPKTDSIVTLGITGGLMPPSFYQKGRKLRFNPEDLVVSWAGKVIAYIRKQTVGTLAPSEFIEINQKAKAKEKSFIKLASQYSDRLNKLINQKVKASVPKGPGSRAKRIQVREDLLSQANEYLHGTQATMQIAKAMVTGSGLSSTTDLTPAMIEVLNHSRTLIDTLTSQFLDFGLVSGTLSKSMRQNIGSYLTRTYRLYTPNSKWKDEVPFEVKDDAVKYFADLFIQKPKVASKAWKARQQPGDRPNGVTLEEATRLAEMQVASILNTTNHDAIVTDGQLSGIPLASMMKRKDLAVEVRNLLGEVRDPLQNILNTTTRIGQMVAEFQAQEAIAKLGLETGLFSQSASTARPDTLFSTATTSTNAKKFPSLSPLFASPEVISVFQDWQNASYGAAGWVKELLTAIRKLTAIGKFNQVVLNLFDSYSVNFLGAALLEFSNGRIGRRPGLTDKAAGGLATNVWRKFKGDKTRKNTKLPSPQQIKKIESMSGKDLVANWNKLLNQPILAETLTRKYGALDENVLVQDIAEGWASETQLAELSILQKQKFKAAYGWVKKHVFSRAGNIYAWPDNAFKVNAFFQEALDYAAAYPNMKLSDIFVTAGNITRATTPVYSKVPSGLKELNLVGVIPTYISFTYEMFRNVWNSTTIGITESQSESPVIRRKGRKRLTFLLGTLALASWGASAIADLIRDYFTDSDELDGKQKDDLTWLMAPWDRDSQNAILAFEGGKKFTYANLSYQIPQAVVTAPFVAAWKGEDASEAGAKFMASLASNFFGSSVLPDAIGQVVYNRKPSGGKIYNEAMPLLERVGDSVKHISENVFMPGFVRKIKRASKIGEENFYGRQYSLLEETLRLFSLRPVTYDIPTAARARMVQFNREYGQVATVSDKEKRDARQAKVAEEYGKFVQSMLRLGMSKREIATHERNIYGVKPGEDKRPSSLDRQLRDASSKYLR